MVFAIKGKYPGIPEETIDEFDTKEEAEKMLVEYRMAYGSGWTFHIRRVRA